MTVNPLTKVAREVVLGMLLGDGSLVKPTAHWTWNKTKTKKWWCACRHYKLTIIHSPAQREYMEWLYNHLKPIVGSPPVDRRYFNPRTGKWYPRIDLVTNTLSYFTRLRKLYYPEGKKAVRRNILNQLTPLSLAVWFMDDGTRNKDRLWIATNSYSYDQHLIIQQYFLEKWNIGSSIVKERNQFKIAFNGLNAQAFSKIIEPFIIPSMKYKLINDATSQT